jgi:hypothetical protein
LGARDLRRLRVARPCHGGSISNEGTLNVTSSTISINTASAGIGRSAGDGDSRRLFVATGASVQLKKTTVSANYASASNSNNDGSVNYL